MSDEVYALGIVYIFNDGSTSPVFHIPGRAPDVVTGTNPLIPSFTNWDTDNITGNVNIFNNTKNKRWQVYNTATKYSTPLVGTHITGLMGYYEVQETYPEVNAPCDTHADGYWGRDWQGNLLDTSTKIRHHRMPGSELLHSSVVEHYRVGINFTIAEDYPDPEIVSHYFVYGDRTFEKTIVDKGLLFPLKEYFPNSDENLLLAGLFKNRNPGLAYGGHMVGTIGDSVTSYAFVSPRTLYEDTFASGTYIRTDKYLSSNLSKGAITVPTGFNSERFDKVTNLTLYVDNYNQYVVNTNFNYPINNAVYLERSEEATAGNTTYLSSESKTIKNTSSNNSWLIISTASKLSPLVSAPFTGWDEHIFQISIKSEVDVFSNLFNISYIRMGNCPSTKYEGYTSNYKLWDGDTFAARLALVDWVYSRSGAGNTNASADFCHAMVECDYMNPEFRHGDFETEGKYSMFQ